MTLSRRALLLVFPVVLLGYAIAALTVFVTQRTAILRLEEAKLESQLANLGVLFHSDVAVSQALLGSLVSGDALGAMLVEPDDGYRQKVLRLRLREGIRSLGNDPRTFVSFAVFDSSAEPKDYFEEPQGALHDGIGREQADVARRFAAGIASAGWSYIDRGGERPLIVNSRFVDLATTTGSSSEFRNAVGVLQVALRPDAFIEAGRRLGMEYGSEISFGPQPKAEGDLVSSITLAPRLSISLRASEGYVARLTDNLRLVLGAGVLVMSLLSVGLIMALVQRFVTRPVTELDRQLTDVMAGRRENIPEFKGTGEVGRLSTNMKRLHDDVVTSFRQLQDASLIDHLTGIGNRSSFAAASERALASATEAGAVCSMLFVDVDNFKFVNDRYGHEAGDRVLRTLARRVGDVLAEAGRRCPTVKTEFARLSGDEFAVLVQSTTSRRAAEEIASEILSLFSGGFDDAGERYPIAVSIGLACYPENAHSVEELISNADAAMYEAKAGGKNRMVSFSSAIADTRRRARSIQEELRRMDPDEEFHLVYMPIVDRDGRVSACEALVRWNSPKLGNVGPDEFVPIAERSGLFGKLDRWVVDRAMCDYDQLADWFGPDFVLSINLSSAELHTSSIRDYLSACLARYSIPAFRIEIELTETFAAGLNEANRHGVDALRSAGFRIAFDDFGTGYTSIQHITDYSASTIKLDRSLVARLADRDGQQTLAALISLCHARRMAVVAEGVDTDEKRSHLTVAGCDLFQGYGICTPRSLADIGIWRLQRFAEFRQRLEDGRAGPVDRVASA